MSEMVERVATAMARAAKDNWDIPPQSEQTWRELARAAIEAMREPTEAMLSAGEPWSESNGLWRSWGAMIDEALEPV